jgi:hypothetical protein
MDPLERSRVTDLAQADPARREADRRLVALFDLATLRQLGGSG